MRQAPAGERAIGLSGDQLYAPPRSDGLFLFDGHFGRLDYRKYGVALFEIQSRHGTSCDD